MEGAVAAGDKQLRSCTAGKIIYTAFNSHMYFRVIRGAPWPDR
jgi:hypothetical protein